MKNILKNLLGDRAYKQLLKLIGNGGGNNGANTIIMEPAFAGGPAIFTEERTNVVYTTLTWDKEAIQEQIDLVQKMIDNNRKIANSIIQSYNDRKLPNIILNDDVDRMFICSCSLYQDWTKPISENPDAICINIITNVSTSKSYLIPVTFSLDGKATIRDYNYHVGTK